MKRILIAELFQWKDQKKRKPLLLDGARQTGKTFLIEKIFGKSFSKVHKFDFLESPSLHSIFEKSLNPDDILKSLELDIGKKINLSEDLVFFDEIGECQKAVSSLKFFCEQKPEMFLCASGSNIGLLDSFPVGKTYNLKIVPMTFYEFLLASENEMLIERFEQQDMNPNTHRHLWEFFLNYYYVGGMPEAVMAWYSNDNIIDKITTVNRIHKDLMDGYRRDFGKYGNKINALHIESIFQSVPIKLQETRDDSVQRFVFKDIIEKKNRYADLRGPIDWLVKTNLVSKNMIISSKPCVPLSGLVKENIFKLFFFDVGLLCHSLGLSYNDIINQDFSMKGFIAENFVQCELISLGESQIYSWQEAKSEIEFLLRSKNGDIYPVEVKSGTRTKAQSLRVYKEKYSPKLSLKLIGSSGNLNSIDKEKDHVWPLYYSKFLEKL